MALSGSFNTTGYEGRYLTFSWSVTNTQADRIENNRSVISWTLKGAGTGQAGWYKAGPFKVVAAGATRYSSSTRIQLYNGTTVASGSFTINHNSDGSGKFSASAEAAIYTTSVNCTGSGTFTLDAIPRKSALTVGNGTVGSALSLKITRGSSTFKHKIQYWCGSLTGYVAGSASTFSTAVDFSWTVPKDFASQNTKGTTVQVKFVLGTYTSAGTLVGYTNKTITCTIPGGPEFYPKCTYTLDDITKVDEKYGSPVQGLSQIKVTVNATPAYGSPVETCEILINKVKYTGFTVTTNVLPYSGNVPVTIIVRDARHRSHTESYTMRVQEYRKPRVSVLSVHRWDAENDREDPQGGHIKVYFEAAVQSLGSKNTADYVLRYRPYNATSPGSFTEVPLNDIHNIYSVVKTHVFEADSTNSYEVEVEAIDAHDSDKRSTTAPTAFALFNVGEDGMSLCFGGVAEEPGAIQNNMKSVQRGNSFCFSSAGVGGSEGYVLMANIEITAAQADSPLTFVFTRRLGRVPMTVHVRFDSVNTLTPLNAYVAYEGENYGAFLSRLGTGSNWALYVQKVSAYDTITLQNWFTSKIMESRVKVTFPGTLVTTLPTPWTRATPAWLRNVLDYMYPVGSVVIRHDHNDPSIIFGGTWERITNAFLWAVDSNGAIGLTGGEKEVTLTVNQIPSHSHGSVYSQHADGTKNQAWYANSGSSLAYGTVATGGGKAHNNMPPYIQVSVWRRTA